MSEKLLTIPVETARMVGQGILWLTEKFVPPRPTIETKAASIQYFTTGDPDDRLAA